MDNWDKSRQGQGAECRGPQGAQMWVTKTWLESEDGTTNSQGRCEGPVNDLQSGIADEAVVDQRDVGPPHQEYDSLEVQFQPQRESLRAVAQEGVEANDMGPVRQISIVHSKTDGKITPHLHGR